MAELDVERDAEWARNAEKRARESARSWVKASKRIDKLVAERDAALTTIAKVEALHSKDEVMATYLTDCIEGRCEHQACPEREVEVCHECWNNAELANSYYGEEGIGQEVIYPCPTIRALGSVPSTGEGNE